MSRPRALIAVVVVACSLTACSYPATQRAAQPAAKLQRAEKPSPAVAWGIPRFFEVGRQVQLDANAPPVDTTGWPAAVLRSADAQPRAYLSASAEDQSSVFVYSEFDPSRRLRQYALLVPEPKTFSTNGVVTAFWGRTPQLMNFALGAARSFGSFTAKTANGTSRVIPVRARLAPSGVNPQESENVYELEGSRLNLFEHKGLIPDAPLSFLEFTVYDRDAGTDDSEPAAVDANRVDHLLSVALLPLRSANWLRRESFETNGYRVMLVGDAAGDSYFLATPLEFRPGWGFGEATTDLALGPLHNEGEVGPGSAAAVTLEHANHGWLLCGMVRDRGQLPALLERGTRFLAQARDARQKLIAGSTLEFATQAAHAFVTAHRSHRDPRTLTRFAHGDAPQPANSTAFSAGLRYGQDLASTIRGLVSVQQASHDATLLQPLADFAEASLEALQPSGATRVQNFDQLALVAEHDENSGRSDVFVDNGAVAVGINHRRLLLASGQTHSPGITWGAFGATIDGQSSSVDEARYSFTVDGASLPRSVSPTATTLGVSRLFSSDSEAIRVRETAELVRGLPAVSVRYQLENRGQRSASLEQARITLADYLEYGTGANEKSQNHYGLGHVAEGAELQIGFWMEGMKTPLWGTDHAPGEIDLTEQYRQLDAHFLVVYGFDRAQIYFLSRPIDRLVLHNAPNAAGLSKLEVRYEAPVTLAPHQPYDLPEVLSYTLRAPLSSADGDAIPDQLQELAPVWSRLMSNRAQAGRPSASSLDTDSGHAALAYSWILAADLLESRPPNGSALAARLRDSALRASRFALSNISLLRNQSDWLPTYANGHDYGFNLALFDWAYRQTCDVLYRDALLSLADDLARPEARGGLQITNPENPSYGGYLSTQQSRASGATRVGDQGIRLWALRIAYERTGAEKYRHSAQLFIEHWLRLDPEFHSFTGTVLVAQRYRDAGIAEERSPLGQYAVLAGLKAWSDLLPRARALYTAGLAAATGRQVVHAIGSSGPQRLLVPSEGIADFSDDAEIGGSFLWATTLEPRALRGRFTAQCRRAPQALGSGAAARR